MRFNTKRLKGLVALAGISAISMVALSTGNTSTVYGAADAAATYKAKCASCHGADGSGNTPAGKGLKLRDLRSKEVQAQSDDQLFQVIAKGKGKMPGYEKTLGADTCKALATYIRTLK